MKKQFLTLVLALSAIIGAARAQDAATPDAAHGKIIYYKCAYCHGLLGKNGPVGPTLVGVIGRQAGSIPDFPYSDDLKGSGIIWDEGSIEGFIQNPAQMIQGTRMIFPGLTNQSDAADMVAYLKTLK
jgi:cytochrome c